MGNACLCQNHETFRTAFYNINGMKDEVYVASFLKSVALSNIEDFIIKRTHSNTIKCIYICDIYIVGRPAASKIIFVYIINHIYN